MGDGSAFGASITYIEQDAPRGLAHAVLISESFVGRDPFVMYLGDNLLARGIAPLVDEFARDHPGRPDPAHPSPRSAAVRRRRARRRQRRAARREATQSRRAISRSSVSICLARASSTRSSGSRPSARNELEITDAIQDLIDRGLTVRPHIVDGWWKDTGKLEDLLEANRLILETFDQRVDGDIDEQSSIEGKVVVESREPSSASPW